MVKGRSCLGCEELTGRSAMAVTEFVHTRVYTIKMNRKKVFAAHAKEVVVIARDVRARQRRANHAMTLNHV